MMFKILVTTIAYNTARDGTAVAVHSVVVEFPTKPEAEAAHRLMEKSRISAICDGAKRDIVKLFD